MLVLVSFGLVLVATILLVVGLLADGDGLNLIYLSIAASLAAAVVLALAFRRARPKTDRAAVAPEPLLPELADDEAPVASTSTSTPAAASTAAATTVAPAVATGGPAPQAAPEPEPEPEPVPTASAAGTAADDDWTADDGWSTDDDWADAGDFAVEFPIADYDELSVAEVMPLLPQLYSDELDVVAERERQGKNRPVILARLEELAATGTTADAATATEDDAAVAPADPTTVASAPAAAPAPAPTPPATPEPAPAAAPERPAPAAPAVSSLLGDDDELPFPIADYDALTADQIVPLLAQLEDDELEDVKAREASGQARASVIAEIDRRLGVVAAADRPAAAPAPANHPFPINDYDRLTEAQIRPKLAALSKDQLQQVRERERSGAGREAILAEVDRRLG